MRLHINNKNSLVPKVKSPISQAVVIGKHCYISGQLSTDAEGNYMEGTVAEEAQRAFQHVFDIAKAAGFDRSELAFIDVAFIDLKDIATVNDLFEVLFEVDKYPARTIYQAAALPYGGKVKVTAIGCKA
jgi:2-iminobutanoate/2-iminopropanoate deaminase